MTTTEYYLEDELISIAESVWPPRIGEYVWIGSARYRVVGVSQDRADLAADDPDQE